MKTKCYSVRLESMTKISDKCYKAVAFDGSEALIPASQVYGRDNSRTSDKSEAWWISAWILERKALQYSTKKSADFNSETGKMIPSVKVEVITPAPIEAQEISPDASLVR